MQLEFLNCKDNTKMNVEKKDEEVRSREYSKNFMIKKETENS